MIEESDVVKEKADALFDWARENTTPESDDVAFENRVKALIKAVKASLYDAGAIRIIFVYREDIANVPDGEIVAIHYNRVKGEKKDGYPAWKMTVVYAERSFDLNVVHTSEDVMWQCAIATGSTPMKDN